MPTLVLYQQSKNFRLVAQNLDEYMNLRLGRNIPKQMYGKICKVGDKEKAIKIAQQKLEQHKREGKTKPSMCLCTTMHELVEEIIRKIQ